MSDKPNMKVIKVEFEDNQFNWTVKNIETGIISKLFNVVCGEEHLATCDNKKITVTKLSFEYPETVEELSIDTKETIRNWQKLVFNPTNASDELDSIDEDIITGCIGGGKTNMMQKYTEQVIRDHSKDKNDRQ
jgi:hypothetical protein